MKRVLVAYGSKMGGTKGIAEAIADTLRQRGFGVTLTEASGVPKRETFDAAVVGSALYMTRWRRSAVGLLKRLAAQGGARVWAFHSGPLGDDQADDPQKPPRKVAALIEQLGAEDVVTFGGILAADAKEFPASAMAKKLAGDWRDMEQVTAWANHIADELGGTAG